MIPSLSSINSARGAWFSIPPFDAISFTYVGATNNVDVQTFKRGGASGTTVATLTYTYVASGASDDDDVASVVMAVPNA